MPEIEPRFLCIIASPRTGSSYVCGILRNITGVQSKTEIFHTARVFSITPEEIAAVAVEAQRTFGDADDPDLRAWMRQNPVRAIRAIARAPSDPPTRLLSFKIFPGQLPMEMISAGFAALPEMRFLTVKRRIIDAYISLSKARLLRQYGGIDTTDTQVVLDATDFIRYIELIRSWHALVAAALAKHGKTCPELRYEEFTAFGDERFVQELASILDSMRVGGLTPIAGKPRTLPRRQDRSSSYEDKVTNWAEFVAHPLVRQLDIDPFGYL